MISDLHGQIGQALRAGRDIDEIEQAIIEPAAIAEDEKSALWLYAQVLSEQPRILGSQERELAAPLGSG
jgi:hypothetical protein